MGVQDYDTTAGNNTAINGIAITGSSAIKNGDNAIRQLMADTAAGRADGSFLPGGVRLFAGHIFGLTLSNNVADATNDIDIAIGSAASSDTAPAMMSLTSALTKRLDAAWAVGTGNGGLDTGVIANTTYHVWLIRRPDTGVVDALFSASATAPTMPANYTQKRRIGAILREGGIIVSFTQFGDTFIRTFRVADRTSTAAQAQALIALSVPVGVVVQPILSATQAQASGATTNTQTQIASAGIPSSIHTITITAPANSVDTGFVGGGILTNTSAQILFAVLLSGTLSSNALFTHGWIDTRGRIS